jgi:hypothetical protein
VYLVQALLALGGRWGEQLQRFLDLLVFGHLYRTLAAHINYRHITMAV